MQKKVLHNQSLLDFVLQHCGTLESLIEIAWQNNISASNDIVPGTLLTIPENSIFDDKIVSFYQSRGVVPATGKIESVEKSEAFAYEFAIRF